MYKNEKDFLQEYDPRAYDPISISVDNVVFGIDSKTEGENYRKLNQQKLTVLLIKRKEHPFLGQWSLPGGFVKKDETLHEAAIRSLNIKTGLRDIYTEQLYTFGNPNRDPRMRIVSCSYLSLIDRNKFEFENEAEIKWFEVKIENDTLVLKSDNEDLSLRLRKTKKINFEILSDSLLAFDHAEIVLNGLLRLQGKIEYTDIVFNLLPEKFTLTQVQSIYEIILGEKLLKAAFRRKITNKITETGEYTSEKGHRPSQYYRFTPTGENL